LPPFSSPCFYTSSFGNADAIMSFGREGFWPDKVVLDVHSSVSVEHLRLPLQGNAASL
jgi:hypothetical protein